MYVCCIYGCPFSKRYSTLFVSYVQVLAGTVVPFEYQWDIVSHTKLTGSTSEQRKRLERPWGQPVTVVLVQTLLEDRHSKLFFYVLWVLSYLVAYLPTLNVLSSHATGSTFCSSTLRCTSVSTTVWRRPWELSCRRTFGLLSIWTRKIAFFGNSFHIDTSGSWYFCSLSVVFDRW